MYLWRPQSGLVPTLVKALTAHAALAQQSTNATTTHNALLHLQRCRSEFSTLSSLVQVGRLSEAVEASEGLDTLLDEAPMPLSQADVIHDIKVGIRTIYYTCHPK
jgi:protein transport protein DSL1/ZW10